MSKPLLAAQLYTVREFTKTIDGVAESLHKVRDIGYTAVQLSGFGPVDPREVARIVGDLRLTVASTHEKWERFLTDLDALIEEHRLYKCSHPAIGGIFSQDYAGSAGVERFLAELAPVAAKLAKADMDFSYHNHSHELVRHDGQTWLEMLYGRGDPKTLKAEIDTYWIQHGGGDPAWWVRRCAGREPILHLKDMTVSAKREQRMAEIGEGNLNWPAILQAADEGGVQYACVEQDYCYERDPFESLAISYRNLRKMGLK